MSNDGAREQLVIIDETSKSDSGSAAFLAERLCLSGRAFRDFAATPPRQRLKQRKVNGKPEAFRKERGRAAI